MLELPPPDAYLTLDELRYWTNTMIDTQLDLIRECVDDDVTFEPVDPKANDPVAATQGEVHMPWTLGHVIVHVTASSEESAFLAAELARGVAFHGRSRSEVPWQTVTTIDQCIRRLGESRRMRLASLDLWPDEPHLDNTYKPWEGAPPTNAIRRFTSGLRHDNSHLEQMKDIIQQAKAARSETSPPPPASAVTAAPPA